ncbi:MAG: pantoate--beta-alanine ligase [Actinobacteria bacterium]|nr:MAG: pantoate--beta-alanine ligase [Actinomycetota bacterium]
MEVTDSPDRLRAACDEARTAGVVGLVPTMGALHAGHARLLAQARKETSFAVLSIFVNPLQFDSAGDLDAYPRTLDHDLDVASQAGCALAFVPSEAAVYPDGPTEVTVDPGPLGERLEGRSRPGHFRGVLTVVAKLLHLAGPARAYFGEKDAQQLALVRRMAADLDEPVTIVGCPTVREPDGLALSSRNARLTREQRRAAPVLFEALSDAAVRVRSGERSADVLRAEMARAIGAGPLAQLDYVAVVDERSWEDVAEIHAPSRALAAARFGQTRLIDNLLLPWPDGRTVHNTNAQGGA